MITWEQWEEALYQESKTQARGSWMNSKQRTVIVAALFIIAALLVVPVHFDSAGRLAWPLSTGSRGEGFMSSEFFRVAGAVVLVAAGLVVLLGKSQ
jgi:hypothetical protein